MNILFTRFPLESAYGGAENQTISLMQGLEGCGHQVSFVGSCPVLLERCEELRIENEQLHIGPPPVTKWGAISFFWRQFAMRKKLLDAIADKPDAIFMLSLSEKILLTPYALKAGIKVIWQEHDTVGTWLTKSPWLSKLRKMSSAVQTVCVSELSAQIFRDLGYANVTGIPNGVESGKWKVESGKQDDQLIIGCIARLSPEKGVDVLVEAISQTDLPLKVLGSGPQKIGNTDQVEVLDRIECIDDFYNQIDVLVLPSRKEDPFGLTVAEAMMRGIPTICTDACGIAAHLTPGVDSIVVEAGSSGALRAALKQMKDQTLRKELSVAGKTYAEKYFTIQAMVDRYEYLL